MRFGCLFMKNQSLNPLSSKDKAYVKAFSLKFDDNLQTDTGVMTIISSSHSPNSRPSELKLCILICDQYALRYHYLHV
jgi:hypothetical protein